MKNLIAAVVIFKVNFRLTLVCGLVAIYCHSKSISLDFRHSDFGFGLWA